MALSDRAAAIGPYAQQLLDNDDVQDAARQAADATRAAYQRARGQNARKAVQDRKLRHRVTAAVAAMGVPGAVSKAPAQAEVAMATADRSARGYRSRSLADQQPRPSGRGSNGYWARTTQMNRPQHS